MLKHIIAVTMIVAVIFACAIAQAQPQFKVVEVGCKLTLKANQELYVDSNEKILIGGGDCNE